jgi:hypothetical protein
VRARWMERDSDGGAGRGGGGMRVQCRGERENSG